MSTKVTILGLQSVHERVNGLSRALDFREAFRTLHAPVDSGLQIFERKRLGQEIKDAFFHQANGLIDRSVTGHHENGKVWIEFETALNELFTAHAGHDEVRDQHVGLTGLHLLIGDAAILSRIDVCVGRLLQNRADHVSDRLLVLGYQNFDASFHTA